MRRRLSLDLKLAPFHLLASEGHVYFNRDHVWHMETLSKLCAAESRLLLATRHLKVDLVDKRESSPSDRVVDGAYRTGRGRNGG